MVSDKDNQIIRQSQLKFVLEYAKQVEVDLKLKEIVGITNVMVDYCLNGYSKELGERFDNIDAMFSSRKKTPSTDNEK